MKKKKLFDLNQMIHEKYSENRRNRVLSRRRIYVLTECNNKRKCREGSGENTFENRISQPGRKPSRKKRISMASCQAV